MKLVHALLMLAGAPAAQHSSIVAATTTVADDKRNDEGWLARAHSHFLNLRSIRTTLRTRSRGGGVSLSHRRALQEANDDSLLTCILITTGTGQYDNGYLDVLVNTGNGYDVVTTTGVKYTQDEVVIDECYSGLVGVQVTGPDTNAWAGSIVSSVDYKASYSPMKCTDCTGTLDTTEYIVVDGNGDGIGDTECLNGIGGNVCTLINLATLEPTTPGSPSISPITSEVRVNMRTLFDYDFHFISQKTHI